METKYLLTHELKALIETDNRGDIAWKEFDLTTESWVEARTTAGFVMMAADVGKENWEGAIGLLQSPFVYSLDADSEGHREHIERDDSFATQARPARQIYLTTLLRKIGFPEAFALGFVSRLQDFASADSDLSQETAFLQVVRAALQRKPFTVFWEPKDDNTHKVFLESLIRARRNSLWKFRFAKYADEYRSVCVALVQPLWDGNSSLDARRRFEYLDSQYRAHVLEQSNDLVRNDPSLAIAWDILRDDILLPMQAVMEAEYKPKL